MAGCGDQSATPAVPAKSLNSADELHDEVVALFEPDRDFMQQVQDEIAACMAEQGFEYVPYVDPALVADTDTESSLSPVIDSFEEAVRSPRVDDSNPNDAILMDLRQEDAQAAEAYLIALWGAEDNLSVERPEGGVEDLDLSLDALGCWNYSATQLTGGADRIEYTHDLLDLDAQLAALVEADDRWVTAAARVEECVGNAGIESLEAQFNEAYERLEQLDLTLLSESEVDKQFAIVRDLEVSISTAELGCEEEAGIGELYTELSNEYFPELTQE